MRKIDVSLITEAVAGLCVKANLELPESLCRKLHEAAELEKSPLCKDVLQKLELNLDSAKRLKIPICQDTGMAVVFLEIGQDVHLTGGDLREAVNNGVEKAYTENYLRFSVVKDPLLRENTNTNTPAVIYTEIALGDKIRITVAPKGFGSENKSRIKMFLPTASADEVIEFITDVVSDAGADACPPLIVGVGIGGTFEYAAYLSKKALCRDADKRNPNAFYAAMEEKALIKINELGIGALGFGGCVTAFSVNIAEHPTHIASLPVAVNIGCHATRHASRIL
jgi:fumarate hydratase subunit alpha